MPDQYGMHAACKEVEVNLWIVDPCCCGRPHHAGPACLTYDLPAGPARLTYDLPAGPACLTYDLPGCLQGG